MHKFQCISTTCSTSRPITLQSMSSVNCYLRAASKYCMDQTYLHLFNRHMRFPIGGPLEPCIYLAPLRRYWAQRYWGHDLDLLGSCDVSDHVTIGLSVGTFLLVVNDDHVPILHGYGDTGLQRFWGHEFDLLGSHDVIGHVTIGLFIQS